MIVLSPTEVAMEGLILPNVGRRYCEIAALSLQLLNSCFLRVTTGFYSITYLPSSDKPNLQWHK
jgi:hypothetical protein